LLPASKAIRCAGETKGGRLVGPPQLRCYLHQAGEAAEGGSPRDRLPNSFAHLSTRQVSRLAGLTDAYRVLGKTFGPGSVFSARLEEHRRLLGMIGDLAQAVAFEDIAVAESLDASADLAGVDPTKQHTICRTH
jgi:hypothetical protein